MIYFFSFIMFCTLQYTSPSYGRPQFPKKFVGSNLFGDGKFIKKCFSVEDVALFSARSKFEVLVPNITMLASDLENDATVQKMLEYLNGSNQLLSKVSSDNAQYLTQAAFYDVVGGYLHYFYLPFVKFSFYAGTLTYNSTLSVYSFQKHCKEMLNTNGNGWRKSAFKFLKMNYKIQPIKIHNDNSSKIKDPCEDLLLASDDVYDDHELIVSLPRIETEKNGTTIYVWLPFKRKRNFILNSKSSAFVLTRYYVDVLKCYEFRKASNRFRFDRRFQKLLNEKILPFINKDEFYPGFGAILRVWETLNLNGVAMRSMNRNDNQYYDDAFSNELPNRFEETYEFKDNNVLLVQPTNQTNIDPMDIEKWNHEKKAQFICLTLIVLIVGLLLICVWMFINRERHMKKTSPSYEREERRKTMKNLIRNLSIPHEKKYEKQVINIDPRRYLGRSDTSSPASGNISLIQPEVVQKQNSSKLNNIYSRNRVSYKATFHQNASREHNNESSSSSSSSTSSESTKFKKRRIYRKIQKELRPKCKPQLRPISKSLITRFKSSEPINAEPHQNYNTNVAMTTKMNQETKKFMKSLELAKKINSSSWETLSSSRAKQIVEK